MERFRIKDLPKIDRPREKLISKGPQNLKDLPRRELCSPSGRGAFGDFTRYGS